MRKSWMAFLVCGSVVLSMSPRIARVQPLDVERVLVERLGFSIGDVGQVRAGQLMTKTLPAGGTEIAVLGVVRVPDDKDRLVRWIRDVEAFRKAADLGMSRKLSSPPTIDDFADLSLDPGDLTAIQRCQPGECALRLGDRAIARFQTEVDWTAADAGRRANALARQLMLEYAEAYLRGGDDALGAVQDERKPRTVAEAFRTLIRGASNLYALANPLATYLEHFPTAQLAGVEQFLYWGKGRAGFEPSITLHHLLIHRDPGGGVYVVNKQLYSSRNTEAALLLVWLEAPADGNGYYLLAGLRARSNLLEGLAPRLLRTRIEEESRSYTEIYLNWIRKSLVPTR